MNTTRKTLPGGKYAILLVLFCITTFFANPSALPTDIMESRNIVTAREMVADGNWLVPTMNGDLRLEKPPLPTWVAAAVETISPGSLAAQRTAAGVMACVWTAYLFLLVRYVSRRDDLAVATVVVFLTCYNLVLMGRSATWDIYCHSFMMAAIYYLTRGLYDPRPGGNLYVVGARRGLRRHALWFALAGVFMGLSFLSKGPVSFYALLLPYLITLVLLPKPDMRGKWRYVALMLALMIVVGGWWYVWLLVAHPAEVEAVVHKESGAWVNHNVRPWWYYWRFFLEMGAWSVLMLAALAVPYWKRHITLKRDYLLAITWAVASLVLLSLMPEKKTRYLLPSLAPCSIVVACLLVHFKQGRKLDRASRWLYVGNGILIAAVILSIPFLAYFFGVRHGTVSVADEVFLSVMMVVDAAALVVTIRDYKPMDYLWVVAFLFMFAECFLLKPIGSAFGNPEARSIHAVQSDSRLDGVPFYHDAASGIRIELVYEAGRKILPLDFHNADSVRAALPCAVVTRGWASQSLSADVLAEVDTVAIGTFDDNKHPRTDRHYTTDFINHVTLLKPRK